MRQRASRLHIGDLEVVPKMAVGVLVVVTFGEIAELPAKALAAGVVLAGRAVAVATPIPKRFGDRLQFRDYLVNTAPPSPIVM